MKRQGKTNVAAIFQVALWALLFALPAAIQADDLVGPRMSAEYRAHHCIYSKYGSLIANSPSSVIANYKREAPDKPLVIYFHGGLVTEDSGIDEAATLSAKGLTSDICYPVFMIWNSDVTTELLNQDTLPRSMRVPAICYPTPAKDSDATKTALSWAQPVCTHVWDACKGDINDAFNLPNGRGVGAQLVRAIARHNVTNRIVLVGHSAGAIYILKFLEAARTAMPDTEFDVIFLAPACSYAYTATMLSNWSREGYQPFRSFRMFNLSDKAERKDRLLSDIQLSDLLGPILGGFQQDLSTLMPWSLLYFVAKDLEHQPNTPILGMECYFKAPVGMTDWQHDVTVFSLFPDPRENVICQLPEAEPGYRSAAEKHSGFFEDDQTLESLHTIVSKMAEDPLTTSEVVRVRAGSLPITVTGSAYPRRHFSVSLSLDSLTAHLDRMGFVARTASDFPASAYGEINCSAPTQSETLNTLNCTLPVRIYKSAGCIVSIHLTVNGVETDQDVTDAVGTGDAAQVVNVSVVAPISNGDANFPVKASLSLTSNVSSPDAKGAFAYVSAGTLTLQPVFRTPFAIFMGQVKSMLAPSMLDVCIIDAALIALLFRSAVVRLVRTIPSYSPAPGSEPLTLEAIQRDYILRARFTTFVSVTMPIIAAYCWYRLLSPPFTGGISEIDLHIGALLVAAIGIGHAMGVIIYTGRCRRLAHARPELDSGSLGFILPALAASILLLPCATLAVCLWIGGENSFICGAFAASILVIILSRVSMRYQFLRQSVIESESPLGIEIRNMLNLAGIEPKRLIRIRSMMANGFALKDGTIAVTTMMAAAGTEREVAAVLAHELSHSIDEDPKRLQRSLALACLPLIVVCGIGGFFLGSKEINGAYMVPAFTASAIALGRLAMFLRRKSTRRLEFKCDAYAAKLGYGPDLASALVLLHRIMRVPHEWLGIDRYTLTHPSLDERLAALSA